MWKIHYRAHRGQLRNAFVVLPAWYGPKNSPPIPLIISPHGRGLTGRNNVKLWGNLPAIGRFAVVNPNGQGRRLAEYSWGYPGQIEDLARMPGIVKRALPWLRVERHRIYAFGGSMGGQETLLLVARYPHLLAGAAAFDSVTDFALQYRHFPLQACNRKCHRTWDAPLGKAMQAFARREIGGTPRTAPGAFAARSPLTYARQIAFSCVPIQFWWSAADRVVIDQQMQSARLFWEILALNPKASVEGFFGIWIHSAEMKASSRLPLALENFGLMPSGYGVQTGFLHVLRPRPPSHRCA